MATRTVLVVGAGLAGLAAAVHAAREGHRVTVVERRRWSGGRVYSRPDDQTPYALDNGQHILTSAYHHMLEYLELIGSRGRHFLPPRMEVLLRDPDKGAYWVRAPKVPEAAAALGAALGFLNLPVPLAARLRMLASLVRMRTALGGPIPRRLDDITAEQWFDELRVPREVRRAFWDLFTVSFVNERPATASAFVLAQQLAWGLANPNATLGYPTRPLSEWAIEPAVDFVRARGGELRVHEPVEGLVLDGDRRVRSVMTKAGEELRADAYVFALPHGPMARIVEGTELARNPFFDGIRHIRSSPISGVDLWFDGPLGTTHTFDGLLGTTIEWVFDRTKMCATPTSGGHYYSLIVSASYELEGKTAAEVVETAMRDLGRHYPEARRLRLLRSRVVREPDGTFRATPGFERLRCPQRTPIDNLFLAGDWTDTGLPATMESAVRSGVLAARALNDAE